MPDITTRPIPPIDRSGESPTGYGLSPEIHTGPESGESLYRHPIGEFTETLSGREGLFGPSAFTDFHT